ncbi:transmembrane channel-like protein 6 [Misgurnus anguillicaudatus]|uniref:transmembrane channel-like protein 6 n=1 Tax=Misgurnus anguillicaudatus TaxID=75329 RepID=UPI003CCF1507
MHNLALLCLSSLLVCAGKRSQCFLKVLCRSCFEAFRSIQPFENAFKSISACFGTEVLIYFTFFRTLFFYNILLILINGLFLLLPQIAIPPHFQNSSTHSLAEPWLLTGTGILTDSVMFYGYYSNPISGNCGANNKIMCPEEYNTTLAYIFTLGKGLFVTCIMLLHSMSKSFERTFRTFKSNGNLALKVFSFWDFNVNKEQSVKRQKLIYTQLKEMLSELSSTKGTRNMKSRLRRLPVHAFIWCICLVSIGLCMLAVYHLCQDADQTSSGMLLIMPVIVSCIIHVLPVFFKTLSRLEHYNSPNTCIYVFIVRNFLLMGCIFSVLVYHWLGKIGGKKARNNIQCWETFVGQEIYRLVLMDLIFAVLYVIFGEFLWGLYTRNVSLGRKKLDFDIAFNILELIYGQTLVWLGLLFAPLLPAVQIGKLFLLFILKKKSLIINFQASKKYLSFSQMNTLFITLLFVPSFTGALACVIYTTRRNRPSSGCGPFRNLPQIFLSSKQWRSGQASPIPSLVWMSWLYIYVLDNSLLLFVVVGLILISIYIQTQALAGQKELISMLQEHMEYESIMI